eukprot:scaffold170390_cov52-Attheya_sp.AAC.2
MHCRRIVLNHFVVFELSQFEVDLTVGADHCSLLVPWIDYVEDCAAGWSCKRASHVLVGERPAAIQYGRTIDVVCEVRGTISLAVFVGNGAHQRDQFASGSTIASEIECCPRNLCRQHRFRARSRCLSVVYWAKISIRNEFPYSITQPFRRQLSIDIERVRDKGMLHADFELHFFNGCAKQIPVSVKAMPCIR